MATSTRNGPLTGRGSWLAVTVALIATPWPALAEQAPRPDDRQGGGAVDTAAPAAPSGSGCSDRDGDWYGEGCALGGDCNDSDPAISPAAVEVCDGRDNDCDGLSDNAAPCTGRPVEQDQVAVPDDEFTIGSELGEGNRDEWPPHRVRIDGFRIDRTEVTNATYRACVDAGRCSPLAEEGSATRDDYSTNPRYDAFPVIQVTWEQAQQLCRWRGGRLPTEAEWEAAARGPGQEPRPYPWGDREPDCTLANFGGPRGCSGDTDEVGRRPAGASPYGAHDMAGNVWEWTSDWYDSRYYWQSPDADPRGPSAGSHRVIRGGCWESGIDSLRVSCRNAAEPGSAERNIGFRCAYDE
jgi:formylglycine-generating enzyme required for sulfatase activity